jgi:hypothetical protein
MRPLLWLVLLLVLPCAGQNASQTAGGGISQRPGRGTQTDLDQAFPGDQNHGFTEQARLRRFNASQYKAMVADADKLLKLATELNAETHGANQGSLTAEQLRKVAEIEKLARGVKDKMRTSVQGVQVFPDAVRSRAPF